LFVIKKFDSEQVDKNILYCFRIIGFVNMYKSKTVMFQVKLE